MTPDRRLRMITDGRLRLPHCWQEHERIHLETSSVLMREMALPLLRRPEGWVRFHGVCMWHAHVACALYVDAVVPSCVLPRLP